MAEVEGVWPTQSDIEIVAESVRHARGLFGHEDPAVCISALDVIASTGTIVAQTDEWRDLSLLSDIISFTNHIDANVRGSACLCLCALGTAARDSFSEVSARLHDDKCLFVKRAAAEALGSVGVEDSRTGDLIAKQLSSSDPMMRKIAALILGNRKEVSQLDAVSALLKDKYVVVREGALCSLGSMGEMAGSKAPAVAEALKEPLLRGVAVLTLGRLGHEGARYACDLVNLLHEGDSQIRNNVVQVLCDMKPYTGDDIVRLLKQARGNKEITNQTKEAVESVIQQLQK